MNTVSTPLVSIIVPVYGVEEYLDQCVSSIVNQTYNNLEIVLVDDGSPDRCSEMCDIWASRDNRIKVIHQMNRGLSAARNSGIRAAHGVFIGFVDSDDWVSSSLVDHCVSQMIHQNSDITVFTYCNTSSNGNLMYHNVDNRIFPSDKKPVPPTTAIRYLLTVLPMYSWSYLAKKNIYIDNNIFFPEGKVLEDVATTYMVFSHARSIVFLDEKLYFYRQRSGSILHTPTLKKIIDGYKVIDKVELDLSVSYPELGREVSNWSAWSALGTLIAVHDLSLLKKNLEFEDKSIEVALENNVQNKVYQKIQKVTWSILPADKVPKMLITKMHLLKLFFLLREIRDMFVKYVERIQDS